MAVIAVVGGPGAPGATTAALALLLAWPLEPGRKILLVECDPDGGAVLAGALEGRVEAVYGLRNLAVADRRGLLAQTLWEQLIDLSPEGTTERLLLPGLTDPTQAPGLAYTWEPLVEMLRGLEPQGYDVILDLGRSGATGPSAVLARRADVVVATLRTTLRGLSGARPRLAALREDLASAGTGADALGLLLIAEGPYSASEVSREFGLPTLGLLPHAPRTARVLSDGGDSSDRRFVRSELMRTARSAADQIQLLVRSRRRRLAPEAQQAQPAALPLAAGQPPAAGRPVAPYPQQARAAQVPPGPGSGAPAPAEHQPRGGRQSAAAGHPLAYPQQAGPAYGHAPLAGLAPQPAAPAPFPGQQPPGYPGQAQAEQAAPPRHAEPRQAGLQQGYAPQAYPPQANPGQPYPPQAYAAQPSRPQPAPPGAWSQPSVAQPSVVQPHAVHQAGVQPPDGRPDERTEPVRPAAPEAPQITYGQVLRAR
ncbi:hypothetical protein [Kitasatospora sp. NPDC057015]|uniref:hypothetical protein n=1 Tax=Kitasatospora sp. NPDC057015 TaxID=3346001 RepID=UPI003641431D